MIINKIFQVAETLKNLQVPGTSYTLAESGLLYEMGVVGDELNIVKISLISSDRAESEIWVSLKEQLKQSLLQIEGIVLTEIHIRYYTNLEAYCPKEVQDLY